jgi:hypothetical protein
MFWLFLACVAVVNVTIFVCGYVLHYAFNEQSLVVQETQEKQEGKEVPNVASWERTEGTDWDDVKMNF